MEIIYAWFDENGFCTGWSSAEEIGTIPIAVTEDDPETDIRNNFRNWHFNVETEELFYNEEKALEEKKEILKGELEREAMMKALKLLMQVDKAKLEAIEKLETLADAFKFGK